MLLLYHCMQVIFLLGTGESGKSTFIKQMRIIHGQGFNSEDQMMYRGIIKKNIISSMNTLVSAMDMLYISYEHEVTTVTLLRPGILNIYQCLYGYIPQ